MPDEDSEAEKMSPLLEVGIIYEANGASRIEISVTDPKDKTSNKCNSNISPGDGAKDSSMNEENIPPNIPVPGECV